MKQASIRDATFCHAITIYLAKEKNTLIKNKSTKIRQLQGFTVYFELLCSNEC